MNLTAVVMPTYNEAGGVAGFLEEIIASFASDVVVIVCDDCSTDDTAAEVSAVAASGLPVRMLRGEVNAGHGPTTVRALRAGLDSGADVVVAVDGDGQFSGTDIARLADHVRAGVDVVEGARASRSQPVFRHVATQATRVLVWAKSRRMPMDANTPLRAYRAAALLSLIDQIPSDAMTPNLHMSSLVRSSADLTYREVKVAWLVRRADPTSSTTFGASSVLPSRRFVSFCARAIGEWLKAVR